MAVKLYPEVSQAISLLAAEAGAAAVRMSGSGACVFAQCANIEAARQVQDRLAAQWPAGWQGFVAQGLDEHPLHSSPAKE